MKACTFDSSFYYRNQQGSYGFAKYIKSRRAFRLVHLTPAGDVVGNIMRADNPAWRCVRRLKNRPSRAAIRAQGW